MPAPYDNIPGIDSTDNFHPDIRTALLASSEFNALKQFVGRLGATALNITDWDSAITNGWYYGATTAANSPAPGEYCIGEVIATPTYVTQTVFEYANDTSSDTKVWRRGSVSGAWTAWYRVRMSEIELDARYKFPIVELAQEDLNTITTSGDYSQSQNADAVAAPNYPATVAGFLQVRAFTNFVYQTYMTYQPDARFFWRTKYLTTWSAWKTVDKTTIGLGNADNTSDVNKPVSTAQAAENAKLAKGLVYKSMVTGSSGSITDAIVNNIATFTFKANRNYRIVWDFSYYATGNSDSLFYCYIGTTPTADAAANLANFTTLDGRTKGLLTAYALGSTQHTGPVTVHYNPGATDLTHQIKFRVTRVVGDDGMFVVANSNERAQYLIYDDGNTVV